MLLEAETESEEIQKLATLNNTTSKHVIARYFCQMGIQILIPAGDKQDIISPNDLIFSINGNEMDTLRFI